MEMRPAACKTCFWWQASDGPLGSSIIKYISNIGSAVLRGASSSCELMKITLKGAEKGCSTCA